MTSPNPKTPAEWAEKAAAAEVVPLGSGMTKSIRLTDVELAAFFAAAMAESDAEGYAEGYRRGRREGVESAFSAAAGEMPRDSCRKYLVLNAIEALLDPGTDGGG